MVEAFKSRTKVMVRFLVEADTEGKRVGATLKSLDFSFKIGYFQKEMNYYNCHLPNTSFRGI